jgi:hypothetical protein
MYCSLQNFPHLRRFSLHLPGGLQVSFPSLLLFYPKESNDKKVKKFLSIFTVNKIRTALSLGFTMQIVNHFFVKRIFTTKWEVFKKFRQGEKSLFVLFFLNWKLDDLIKAFFLTLLYSLAVAWNFEKKNFNRF